MPFPASNYLIIQAAEVTDELIQACQRLVPQLTNNNPPPTRAELALMLSEGASALFIARDQNSPEGAIVGLATLVMYRVPTGLRGYIEDVVVDEKARGKGIGAALTRACLERAEQSGCPQVMLTTHPGRKAANRLYQHMGFEHRNTNVYRYYFKR